MLPMKSGISKNKATSLVVKAFGLFGSVQFFTMLFSVVRTKLVAVWIGPAGVGLFGVFNTTLDMLASVTQLSMRTSAVKEIAQERENTSTIARTVRRWAFALGIAGTVLCAAGAPLLSQWTFGDTHHSWNYIVLSLSLLFTSLTGGESALLQGKHLLKDLAKASVWGNMLGLAVSVPLFYFFRIDSIAWSITAYSLAAFIAFFFLRYKVTFSGGSGWRETYERGKGFISLGIYLTVSSAALYLGYYIFMSYLMAKGGAEEVGYYQAGFTIINKYAGVVFMVLGMEFYPRLASVAGKPLREGAFVNHESRLVITALVPVVIALICFRGVAVDILYDSRFEVIGGYVAWGIIGTLLRAVSWCMSYVMIVRGDSKVYLAVELSSVAIYLVANIVGYSRWGITGLGYAYLAWYALYTMIAGAVYRFRYHLKINPKVSATLAGGLLVSIITALLSS